MAGELTAQTELSEAPSGSDFIDLVDVSDTTDSPQGSSKKLTVQNLLLAAGIKVVPGFEGYIIIAASGNSDPTIVQEDDVLVGSGAYYNGEYVMMRALQDNPTQDSEFIKGVSGEE